MKAIYHFQVSSRRPQSRRLIAAAALLNGRTVLLGTASLRIRRFGGVVLRELRIRRLKAGGRCARARIGLAGRLVEVEPFVLRLQRIHIVGRIAEGRSGEYVSAEGGVRMVP